jgi:hypothetical protein
MREPTEAELKAKQKEIEKEIAEEDSAAGWRRTTETTFDVLIRRLARVEAMCENARREDR